MRRFIIIILIAFLVSFAANTIAGGMTLLNCNEGEEVVMREDLFPKSTDLQCFLNYTPTLMIDLIFKGMLLINFGALYEYAAFGFPVLAFGATILLWTIITTLLIYSLILLRSRTQKRVMRSGIMIVIVIVIFALSIFQPYPGSLFSIVNNTYHREISKIQTATKKLQGDEQILNNSKIITTISAQELALVKPNASAVINSSISTQNNVATITMRENVVLVGATISISCAADHLFLNLTDKKQIVGASVKISPAQQKGAKLSSVYAIRIPNDPPIILEKVSFGSGGIKPGKYYVEFSLVDLSKQVQSQIELSDIVFTATDDC